MKTKTQKFSRWEEFNFWWTAPSYVEGEKLKKCRWWNWPKRRISYIYSEFIAPWLCEKLGHKWHAYAGGDGDREYSICTRCGADTEAPYGL